MIDPIPNGSLPNMVFLKMINYNLPFGGGGGGGGGVGVILRLDYCPSHFF